MLVITLIPLITIKRTLEKKVMLRTTFSRPTMKLLAIFCGLFLAPMANAQLYLVHDNSPNSLYRVDVATAASTLVGAGASAQSEGLALSNNPTDFFGVTNDGDLYTIARNGNGTSTLAGDHDADRGLTFNTVTGILYGSDNSTFGSIDPITNTLTPLASPPGGDTEGLAADRANNVIFGVDNNENLVAYDVVGNSWSTIGATGVDDGNDIGLAFDPDTNTLYAVTSTGALYSVNPSDGTTTTIGNTGLGSSLDVGLTFVSVSDRSVAAPVPTMSDYLMIALALMLALIGIAALRRREIHIVR